VPYPYLLPIAAVLAVRLCGGRWCRPCGSTAGRAGWPCDRAVRDGLARVVCPGRIDVVSRRPAVVIDTAHNVASIEALVEVLGESFSVGRRLLVFAASSDKEHREMLNTLLPNFDEALLARFVENPRSVPPVELAAFAEELTGRRPPTAESPAAARDWIAANVHPDDLVCVTGSFFIAAEMRRELAARPLCS